MRLPEEMVKFQGLLRNMGQCARDLRYVRTHPQTPLSLHTGLAVDSTQAKPSFGVDLSFGSTTNIVTIFKILPSLYSPDIVFLPRIARHYGFDRLTKWKYFVY